MADAPRKNNRRSLFVNGEALSIAISPPASGGGAKFHPRTLSEAREILAPQIKLVVQSVSAIPSELRDDKRVYIEAKLLPNYISASDFPSSLLAEVHATPVGSRAATAVRTTAKKEVEEGTRRLILAIEDDGLREFSEIISDTRETSIETPASNDLVKIDEIAISKPSAIAFDTNGITETFEAVLHPAVLGNGELGPATQQTLHKLATLVASFGGELVESYLRNVESLTFVPLRLPSEAIDAVEEFNPLRALRRMPLLRPISADSMIRSATYAPPPVIPRPISDEPKVAVFDGGVLWNEMSSPYFPVTIQDLTNEAPVETAVMHGAGVTGAALYGLLVSPGSLPQPMLPLDSYRIIPSQEPDPAYAVYWVLDRVKEVVSNRDYGIINLSYGPRVPVEGDAEPDRWTSELDRLSFERNCLFVVAVGNDGECDSASGLNRVQPPSDMANGLSVGASTSAAPESNWRRASYSCVGPGRQGNRIQPTGVQFGGEPLRPFPLLSETGELIYWWGTSFAAPLTVHALSELATVLPTVNPSILRTFAVHFAERPARRSGIEDTEIGYGRLPISFIDELLCSPDEFHVLYTADIRRGQQLGYQIPIPRNFSGRLRGKLTLVYATPVDPTQPTEYTLAALQPVLRPHSLMYFFYPPDDIDEKPKILDITGNDATMLLEASWTSGTAPAAKNLTYRRGRGEAELRDAGKWETIRQAGFILEAGACYNPSIEISYLARRAGMLDRRASSVPFAMLLSFRDPDRSGVLYDVTAENFPVLTPLQLDVPIQIGVPAT